jgi:hypothetical protein
MPSSSAKQHRFMQAVAHSPSFAKKAGVSQSVGKDFSADKSKTFKKGDMMKKRYDTGGEVDFDADDDPESQKVFRDYSGNSGYDLSDDDTGALAENTPTRSTAKAAPAASSRAASARARAAPAATASRSGVTPAQEAALVRRERETQETEISKREAAEDKGKSAPKLGAFSNTAGRQAKAPSRLTGRGGYEADEMGAVTGRRGDPKYKRVVTDKQKAKNAENFGTVATALIPGGTAIKGAQLAYKGLSAAEKLRKLDKANVPMREIIEARRLAGYAGRKKGGAIMESKKMMGGGMAYAKGGGIESRGKTKGTVIRMAAGGSVSARADGIAQRGKTKFKNY